LRERGHFAGGSAVALSVRLLPTLSERRERKLSGNMPNRASNMLAVPKSEGIQCEIFENSRWIGFSEDDGRSIAEGANIGGRAALLPTR
jgi:hypothetical protein